MYAPCHSCTIWEENSFPNFISWSCRGNNVWILGNDFNFQRVFFFLIVCKIGKRKVLLVVFILVLGVKWDQPFLFKQFKKEQERGNNVYADWNCDTEIWSADFVVPQKNQIRTRFRPELGAFELCFWYSNWYLYWLPIYYYSSILAVFFSFYCVFIIHINFVGQILNLMLLDYRY